MTRRRGLAPLERPRRQQRRAPTHDREAGVTAADAELGSRVAARADRAGVPVDAACAARLAAYLTLLHRWNARMNLTALDTGDRGLDRLVIEPLAAARHLPRRGALIDIGSGGGTPAIPIKIANPGLTVRMVESKARKGAFLREAVRSLGLDGTVVEGCRYEGLMTRPELREAHDVLTLRAVRVGRRGAAGAPGIRPLRRRAGALPRRRTRRRAPESPGAARAARGASPGGLSRESAYHCPEARSADWNGGHTPLSVPRGTWGAGQGSDSGIRNWSLSPGCSGRKCRTSEPIQEVRPGRCSTWNAWETGAAGQRASRE